MYRASSLDNSPVLGWTGVPGATNGLFSLGGRQNKNKETKTLQQDRGPSLSYLSPPGQCHALKEGTAQVMGECVLPAPCISVISTICVQRAVCAKRSQGAKPGARIRCLRGSSFLLTSSGALTSSDVWLHTNHQG